MLVAIATTAPSGTTRVEEFRESVSTAQAVSDFCNEYSPALNTADYVGHDTGWSAVQANAASKVWHYDHDTPGLVEVSVTEPLGSYHTSGMEGNTNNTTYTRIGQPFAYPGTDKMRLIIEIVAIVYDATAATTYDLRLYDATNGLVIAEVTGQHNTSEAMVNLGTIANLPAGGAIFEVQARVSATTNTVYVQSICIGG